MKNHGYQGLFRGTALALVGVSNGAIQFMAYEKMKKWGFDRKRKQFEKAGLEWTPEVDKLVSLVSVQVHTYFVLIKLFYTASPTSLIL